MTLGVGEEVGITAAAAVDAGTGFVSPASIAAPLVGLATGYVASKGAGIAYDAYAADTIKNYAQNLYNQHHAAQ